MIEKSANISQWAVLLALVIGLMTACPAFALRVNFQSQGDSERMVFSFDSGEMPDVKVQRVGVKSLRISLPADIWDTEARPGGKDYPGKLVKDIRAVPGGVELETRTNEFGYIKIPVAGKPQFILQLYRDPIGARWKPPVESEGPNPAPEPASDTSSSKVSPASPAPAPQAPSTPDNPVQQQSTPALPQPENESGNEARPAQASPEGVDLPPEAEEHRPFFSVPYSVRSNVTPPGQEPEAVSARPVTDSEQESRPITPVPDTSEAVQTPEKTPSGVYPPASELRFKAVDMGPEEAQFAELADNAAAPEQMSNQVGGTVNQPVSGGSGVPPASGQGAVGGSVSSPPESTASQSSDVVTGQVAQPVVETPEVSGQGQAGGTVVPPPSVVEGAPPPQPTPDEADAEKLVADQMAPSPEQPAIEETDDNEPQTTPVEGETVAEGAEGGPAEPQIPREEQIRNQLYEAQSLMFNGALEKALPLYEDILKQPDVPDDVREETLFAVADIKNEIHKDDLEDNYNEVTQAYIEAMNANQRSNKVPRALLNLGLINLKVGNFPEAKAYFKLLQDRFPDDDNIPSISYYWGEYYYRKGDYTKAADQFQYLIQTYPEHELVKRAAYYLADSLNRTGFIEQAFQIVDYIDKRWPDYYMENPQFLRLAGDVETKLKKWKPAKDHYFTYYNLNPEAEGADVVLARLGDLYIHQDEQDAAKQLYQKAIEEFPDREGGLVAKMRLAEEGIFDEPTLSGMATVFNRPYNKRPENIYKEIIEKHPDSRLAPIAQLKLAMWYGYHKQYPEALTAAQDFIEKYPDNQFIDRARRLGDSVFALAVPGMVDEERFGRVVRYWETYDFIGQKDTKVDDKTRLNVALSYWKVGQPDKALEILKPYLEGRQRPGISGEALGLAVNIYLDGLAWGEIADLIDRAKKNWKLEPKQLRQLDYARAMSLQNLGKDTEAQVLWAQLAKDMNVEPAFRAYAMYYMAKSAMERQDLRRVFLYSQEALTLLLQTKGDPEKIKDSVLMSIYATERSGRYEEALKWARQYDDYIDVDNPEWASTRFKLARIYRKAGAIDEWKQLLTDIIEKKPDSLQAQLAKSALDTYALEQQVQQYVPSPQ